MDDLWRIPRAAYAIFNPDGRFLFFADTCPSPQFYRWIPVEVGVVDDRGVEVTNH
jgi:hypothetical protein